MSSALSLRASCLTCRRQIGFTDGYSVQCRFCLTSAAHFFFDLKFRRDQIENMSNMSTHKTRVYGMDFNVTTGVDPEGGQSQSSPQSVQKLTREKEYDGP